MKSSVKSLLKVLLATVILCLFTAIGASAEVKQGTFTDAAESADAPGGFVANNEYTFSIDTETGHLVIDAAKNTDGSYAHDGKMSYDFGGSDTACNTYIPWRDDAFSFEDGTGFTRDMIKSVEIGPGIKKLGRRLLSKTSITTLTVPATVTDGSEWGFATDCDNLETITFESGVTSVGMKFAYGCPNLKDVYLPATVTYIHPQAFGATSANVHFYPTSKILVQIKNMRDTSKVWAADNENLNYVPINNMREGEFTDDKGDVFTYTLTADFDPDTYDWDNMPIVTKILTVDSKTAGDELSKIMFPDADDYSKLPQYLDKDSGKTTDQYPWVAEDWRDEVTEVTFGENIVNVGRSLCQGMNSLTRVTVPGNVHSAEWGAFHTCPALETVVIDEGFIKFRSGRAFNNCTALKDIYLPLSLDMLNSNMFQGAANGINIHYWNTERSAREVAVFKDAVNPIIRTGVLTILAPDSDGTENAIKYIVNMDNMTMEIAANRGDDGALIGNGKMRTYNSEWSLKDAEGNVTYFELAPYNQIRKALTEITVGDGIEYVASSMMVNAIKLRKITFGSSVKMVESFAINGSESLETVEFAEGIETLKSGIFNNCTNLTAVTVPKSATSVGTVLRHTSSWQSAPDNVVITAYKGSDGEGMLFGMNADKEEKFTAANQEYRRNEAKIINDDGSVAYVLLNPNSNSALAAEAAANGYKVITFGAPTINLTADGAEVVFMGKNTTGIIVAVKKNADGKASAIRFGSSEPQRAGVYSIAFDDEFKGADGTAKVMLWQNLTSLKPLCVSK